MVKFDNDSIRKVLSLLFQRQMMSRKELAEETGFSKATISLAVEQLLSEGLLMEKGSSQASRNGGPRPINLVVREEYAYILTMLIRLDEPMVSISTMTGETLKSYPFSSRIYANFQEMLEEAVVLAKQAIGEYGPDKILGVGVSIPGNVKENKIINSPYYSPDQFDLTEYLREQLRQDIFVERDVYSMAYGERWKGCGRQYRDFFTVWIGTSIGCAAMIDSNLLRGVNGLAGEMGFMAVSSEDVPLKPYTLNDFGPFEQKVSLKNLERKYWAEFTELAGRATDRELMQDIRRLCDSLTMGLVNAVVLLNPEAIIINGRFRYIQKEIRDYLAERLQLVCPIPCKLEYSDLGTQAIIVGSVSLVLSKKLGIQI